MQSIKKEPALPACWGLCPFSLPRPRRTRCITPRPKPPVAWAPQPLKLSPYVAPNRPVWRLSEILAKHARQKDWSQPVFNTRDFKGAWISMAPGKRTKTLFYADDRVIWVIQSGQIRFTIEGQEPFVAGKGFIVQVPERLQYSMETVGDVPSLRLEITPSGEYPQYPVGETPTPVKGWKYVQATYAGKGKYDAVNKPYLDYYKTIVQEGGTLPDWYVVKDDHTGVEILREAAMPDPPASNWGHFHENWPEIWLDLDGEQDYLIEGEPLIHAHQGDIVFAPAERWHRVTSAGTGMSARMPIIPRPDNLHYLQPDPGN